MRKKEREITDPEVIRNIFNNSTVCRVAMANGDMPYIVAMNYGFSGFPVDRLYFHCAVEGRKLDMIRKNNYVCFQIDCDHQMVKGEAACDFTMKYKSITGYGFIQISDDPEIKKQSLDHIMDHYSPGFGYTYLQETLRRTFALVLDIKELTAKYL